MNKRQKIRSGFLLLFLGGIFPGGMGVIGIALMFTSLAFYLEGQYRPA